MRIKAIIISFVFLCYSQITDAQNKQEIQLRFFQSPQSVERLFPDEILNVDSTKVNQLIHQRLSDLYKLGYLACTYHQSSPMGQKISIEFYTGAIYKMVELDQGNIPDEIMNKIGFKANQYQNKSFSNDRTVRLFNAILDYAENNGYPFAAIKLDSIRFEEEGLSASINYRAGPEIVFDSLYVMGYEKVKPQYLMTHLGIYQGKPYEEEIIQEISNKIKLLPFVKLIEEPEVTIKEGKCSVSLKLQSVKMSQIDGILGMLPNQKEGKDLLITGRILLDLRNLFASGKRIAFEWQSYDASSQLLDMVYFHPNLFKTPINIQGGFNLLKQDTTFLNRSFKVDLSILTKGSSQIGFSTDFFTSRIISTIGLEDVDKLPENNDFNLNYYGITYRVNKFDNIILPTKGWELSLSGSVGQKKIIKNPVVDDDVYEQLALNSLQIKLDGSVDKFWPVYRFLILRTRLMGGYLKGDNLFPGDLYRIGGLKTIRGFTEKSFYASGYGVMNVELRALLSSETYFMVFFDQSLVQNESAQENKVQYPLGTGVGFSFSTDAGIFNFIIGVGKSDNQTISLSSSKIHFGYIGRF